MSNSNQSINNTLSHENVLDRARKKWNEKTSVDRIRCGHKYCHIFEKLKLPQIEWDNTFEKLTKFQTNILIKGELIRTYDSMPNRDKTKIKEHFGLSTFSSKWFRLPPCDKKILLNSVLRHEEQKE